MEKSKVREIVHNGLSHISSKPAQIAEDEIVREIENYIRELEHFRNIHIGLWATDQEPKDKTHFFQITK